MMNQIKNNIKKEFVRFIRKKHNFNEKDKDQISSNDIDEDLFNFLVETTVDHFCMELEKRKVKTMKGDGIISLSNIYRTKKEFKEDSLS